MVGSQPDSQTRTARRSQVVSVDYTVYGPSDKGDGKELLILHGEKERQGDYVFTANHFGEYRFCFDNSLSTFSDKLVDFEIGV